MKKILSAVLALALVLGCFGVSYARFLHVPEDSEHSPLMEVVKCEEWVSLREKPDTGSKRLAKIYKGALVYYDAESTDGFLKVEYMGKTGYILAKYLKDNDLTPDSVIKPNQQVVKCEEWVSQRMDPDTKADRVAKVPLGAVVTRCLDEGEWTYCTYNGKTGYILSKYLSDADYDKIKKEEEERKKAEEEAAQNFPKEFIACMQVVNASTWVSLREKPDATSKRLDRIPAGEYLYECLYENINWVRVTYGDQTGYVSAAYLKEAESPTQPNTGFDTLPALPPYETFMNAGNLVCEYSTDSFHVIARRAYANDVEKLLAVCYDSENRPLWTSSEEAVGIAQVDITSAFIGGTADEPCLVTFCAGKGFIARAIDEWGTYLWMTDCRNVGPEQLDVCPGGGLTALCAEDGTVYASGFFNDAPIAIGADGTVLWKGVNPDPINIFWPYSFEVRDGRLEVLYDSCMEEPGKCYCVLYDLKDGSCAGYSKIDDVRWTDGEEEVFFG